MALGSVASSGNGVAAMARARSKTTSKTTKKTGKTAKKRSKPLTEEEKDFLAKQKRLLNRRGIWEVTIDNGIVLGLYEGTPNKIGAYVAANQAEAPKSLYFQLTNIKQVPEEIAKERCCDRKFTRRDNFCPVCGAARRVSPSIPEGVKAEIDTGS